MDRRPLAATLALGLVCVGAHAGSAHAESRHPVPTLPWAAAQLVPSPGHAWDRDGQTLSLRWQVTPFLYSWGIHRRAPLRVRMFVVEPPLRNTGSVETWLAPEWLRDGHRWIGRGGLRSTFPAEGLGEAVSVSVGTGLWTDGRDVGPVLEVGVYVLFGVFGVQLSHAPGLRHAEWAASLSWRVL